MLANIFQSRGVKAAPVTIVDDEVIIGYYPKKLLPALKLDVKVDLGSNTEWLADKYDRILGATIRATGELSRSHLEQQVPWRPQTLGELIIHILSFPELAWLSHRARQHEHRGYARIQRASPGHCHRR